MPRVEQELAHHRLAVITVRPFGKQEITEFACVAEIGKIVRAAATALDLASKSEPELRLADEVERRVGKGNVLFESGCMAAPFREAMAEDQRIVAHPQQEFEQRRTVDGRFHYDRSRHHMCPTSSGMSKKVGWR